MLRIRYFILGFLLIAFSANNALSDKEARDSQTKEEAAGSAQPVEKEGPSWKYLVERTITRQDNLANKKKVHIDRAFIYFGAEAKKAGGQRESSPEVVYIDKDENRLPDGQAPTVYPFNPFRERLSMTSKLPKSYVENPEQPLPVDALYKFIEILPIDPDIRVKPGMNWNREINMCTNYMAAGLWFLSTISHEVKGYERKKGRRCAVIEYTIVGQFKSKDHPERFTEEQRQEFRGEYYLKGSGTAYFDPVEGIIVEKDQTTSWTRFGEKLWRFEDGRIGWKPTADKKTTVTISVSLIPEERPKSRLLVYLLIGAGIVIAGLILLLKKKAISRGKSCAT